MFAFLSSFIKFGSAWIWNDKCVDLPPVTKSIAEQNMK